MKKVEATFDKQPGEPSRLGFLSLTIKVIPSSAASLLIIAVSSGISTKSLADTVGFSGDFAPANWTFIKSPGSNGSVDTTGAPTSIRLTGSDGASSTSKLTNYRIAAPSNGTVGFSWSYVSSDTGGVGYDNPQFYNNGTLSNLSGFNISGAVTQNGVASYVVTLGNIFGFTMDAVDNFGGSAYTIFSSFLFTPASTDILSGGIYQTSNIGSSVNPVFDGGTLQVSNSGAVASNFTVTDNNGTIDQAALSSIFDGVISDATAGVPGGLSISNTGAANQGSVTFAGVNTYTGGTIVNSGATLIVSGISPTGFGNVYVNSGGTLMGTGTINGEISVSGSLKPGNSPGYLAATNTVTMYNGSIYVQDIAGNTKASSTTPVGSTGYYSSLSVAGGKFDINSGATLTPRLSDLFLPSEAGYGSTPYTPVLGDRFRIVTAEGGISGKFATVTQPAELMTGTQFLPFYNMAGSNSLDLAVIPTSYKTTIASASGSKNAQSVGSALDKMVVAAQAGTSTAAQDQLLYATSANTAASLSGYAQGLSGESYASEQSVLLNDGLYSRTALLGRLRQGAYAGQGDALALLSNGGPTLTASTKGTDLAFGPQGTTTWGQAFGSRTELDGESDTSDVSSNFGGIMTGADTQVESWLVGAAIGYTQSSTTVDDLSSSSDVDSLMAALYAGTASGPWSVRLGATYASNQTASSRTIAYPGFAEQASANYNSATTQLFAEVAYGLVMGTAAAEPFAGLAWINVETDGFSETGATAGLSVASSSSSVTYGTLGVRAATSVVTSGGMVLQPRGALAWQTASGDLSPSAQMAFVSAPNAGFTVSGAPLADNAALIEIGADLLISEQAQLGLSYVGQYADGVSSYGLQAAMTWRF